jgi:hypothetical protein
LEVGRRQVLCSQICKDIVLYIYIICKFSVLKHVTQTMATFRYLKVAMLKLKQFNFF